MREKAEEITRLKEELEDWKENNQRVLADARQRILADARPSDEVHCSCCVSLRIEIERLNAKIKVYEDALRTCKTYIDDTEKLLQRCSTYIDFDPCGHIGRRELLADLPKKED